MNFFFIQNVRDIFYSILQTVEKKLKEIIAVHLIHVRVAQVSNYKNGNPRNRADYRGTIRIEHSVIDTIMGVWIANSSLEQISEVFNLYLKYEKVSNGRLQNATSSVFEDAAKAPWSVVYCVLQVAERLIINNKDGAFDEIFF